MRASRRPPARRCPVPPPARRGRRSRRARGRAAAAAVAGRARGVSGGAGGMMRGVKLLVCGGAGFIGSTFARQRLREHGDQVEGARQAHLRGPRGELPGHRRGARLPFHPRRDRGREAVSAAVATAAPEAIVNFAAETHVDRSIAEPDAFVSHARARHLRAAGLRARARIALPAGLHRRGVRVD